MEQDHILPLKKDCISISAKMQERRPLERHIFQLPLIHIPNRLDNTDISLISTVTDIFYKI